MDANTWQFVSQVGPTGLVSAALVYMVNEHRKLSALYNTLQELRVTEAKANTNAMLAVYEKVERLLDQIQELRK